MKREVQRRRERACACLSAVFLFLQSTAFIFVSRHTLRARAPKYETSAVILAAELLKYSTCCVVVRHKHDTSKLDEIVTLAPAHLNMAVPSLLYTFQNKLSIYAVKYLAPTIYAVFSQSKVIYAALFTITFLQKKMSFRKLSAICTLAVGMACVVTSEDTTSSQPRSQVEGGNILGICLLSVSCLLSGFNATYLERIYSKDNTSIWVRNIQLGTFAVPILMVEILVVSIMSSKSIFETCLVFDFWIAVLIGLQAFGGLIVGNVMKSLGAIMKCIIVAGSLLTTIMFDTCVRGASLNIMQWCGVAMVASSVVVYQ